MADDFLIFKERRFLGITERRWISLRGTFSLAVVALAIGFAAFLGADRVKVMASNTFAWAKLQTADTQASPVGTSRQMGFCRGAVRINCVVDGDTIWVSGEKIRLQSIDAPEIDGKCTYEKDLAEQAKRRLNELLSAEPFSIVRSGKDRYGRTLAAIHNSHGEVGGALVREGLARPWIGRRMPWC